MPFALWDCADSTPKCCMHGVLCHTMCCPAALARPPHRSFKWPIPASTQPRDTYIVVVIHAPGAGEEPAPQHANTFTFAIRTPGEPCPKGACAPLVHAADEAGPARHACACTRFF